MHESLEVGAHDEFKAGTWWCSVLPVQLGTLSSRPAWFCFGSMEVVAAATRCKQPPATPALTPCAHVVDSGTCSPWSTTISSRKVAGLFTARPLCRRFRTIATAPVGLPVKSSPLVKFADGGRTQAFLVPVPVRILQSAFADIFVVLRSYVTIKNGLWAAAPNAHSATHRRRRAMASLPLLNWHLQMV